MSHQGVLSSKQQEAAFQKILKKQCNSICADCSSKSPTWASLDFGVFVCYNCSGQHRALGQNITRVRSTKLDCWTQENVDLMDTLGNDQNEYWESRLQKNYKIQPSATPEEIKLFVQEKYVKRTWVKQGQADPKTRYTQCLMSGVPFRVSKTNTFFSENGTQGQQMKDDMKQFHSTQQQGIQRNNRQLSIDSKQIQKEATLISPPDKGKEFDWNSFNHFSTFSGVPQNHSFQTNQQEMPPKKQQQNEEQSLSFKAKHNNLNEFDLLTYSIQPDNQQFLSHNPSHSSTQQQSTHSQFNTYNPQLNATTQSLAQVQKQAQIQSQQQKNQQINQQQQQFQLLNLENNTFGSYNQQQMWGASSYQQPQQQQTQQYNQASSKPPLPGKQNGQVNYQNTNYKLPQTQQQQMNNQINYQSVNYTQQQPQVQQQLLNQQQQQQQQQAKQQQQQQYQYYNQSQQNNTQNFWFDNQSINTSNQQMYQGFNNDVQFLKDQGNINTNNNYYNTNTNNQQYHQFNTTNQSQSQKYQNNPFAKDEQDIRNLYNTQQPGKYDQLRNNPYV